MKRRRPRNRVAAPIGRGASVATRAADARAIRQILSGLFAPAVMLEDAAPERFAEYVGAFNRCLADAVTKYPRVKPDKVRSILGSPLDTLSSVRDLPTLVNLEALYRQAAAVAGTMQDHMEADAMRTRLAAVVERRERLCARADAVKLGGRHKWNLWPEEMWDMTPAEIARNGGRYSRPERWAWIGDRIVALADYLSPCISGERSRGRLQPTDPRPYKQNVLKLTADLVTFAYWIYFPLWQRHPLTAADVKARILARRVKARRVK